MSSVISCLNNAIKHGKIFTFIPHNKFSENIIIALYKYQFISGFFVNKEKQNIKVFFRYKKSFSSFSEIKNISTPSRMLSYNRHDFLKLMRKRSQDFFFFSTSHGIKAYNSLDFFFLKKSVVLGFLLFVIRV